MRSAALCLFLVPATIACGPRVRAPTAARAQPSETGPCSDRPRALPQGTPWRGEVSALGTRASASCLRRDVPACLFSFEVSQRSDLRAALLSLGFDGALALFAAPPTSGALGEPGVEIACVDDSPLGDTQHARLDLSLDPGRYALAVAAPRDTRGDFELFAELEALPRPESVCAAAQPLAEGLFQRGSTRGGASSFASRCAGRAAGPDDVYTFALSAPARVRARVQSEFQAVLSLRGACPADAGELACSDESASGLPSINAQLDAGRYFLVVDGAARNEGGEYVLAWERAKIPAAPSEAQRCAAAESVALNAGWRELDTFVEPSLQRASCGGVDAPDTAFRFALPSSGTLTLLATDLEFDPVFSLRRACESAETEILCVPLVRAPGAASGSEERTVFQLQLPVGAYTLLVDGQTPDSMGAGSVRLKFEPSEPLVPRLSAAPRAP